MALLQVKLNISTVIISDEWSRFIDKLDDVFSNNQQHQSNAEDSMNNH